MNKKLLIAILLLGLFLPCRVYAGNTYVINNKAAGNAIVALAGPLSNLIVLVNMIKNFKV